MRWCWVLQVDHQWAKWKMTERKIAIKKEKRQRNGKYTHLKSCHVFTLDLHDSSLDKVKSRASHHNNPPPTKKKKRHTHIHIFDSKVKGISVFSVTQRQAHRESNRNTNMVLILHLVWFFLTEMKTKSRSWSVVCCCVLEYVANHVCNGAFNCTEKKQGDCLNTAI